MGKVLAKFTYRDC